MGQRSRQGLIAQLMVGAIVLGVATGACSAEEDGAEETGQREEAVTTTLTSSGDTYLKKKNSNANSNFGTSTTLSVSDGDRALIRFSSQDIDLLSTQFSSTLKVTISASSKWVNGQTISLHRMTTDWTEGGATFNCAIDSAPTNNQPDCSGATAWSMGGSSPPFVSTATAVATVNKNQTGLVTFDVSADIALFKSGTANYGWVLKKTDETSTAQVQFKSRETTAPPVLVGDDGTDGDAGTSGDAGDGGTDDSGDAGTQDTDGDGLPDSWETQWFGNLLQSGSGDFDGDGMTNLEEYTNAFNPIIDEDAFDDADGDRYPNVFELRNGADPKSAASHA